MTLTAGPDPALPNPWEDGTPTPTPPGDCPEADAARSPLEPALLAVSPIPLGDGETGPLLTLDAHAPVTREAFAALESGDIVTVIQQLEGLKAWADYVSLAATAELTRREERAALDDCAPDTERHRTVVQAHSATADELVLATGTGYREALARVVFSIAHPARTEGLRDRMRDGILPWHRARVLHEECQDLAPALAADIADAVLASTPGGAALSGGLFRQRLTRRLAKHADTATKRAHALASRTLSVLINPDGTGTLTLTAAAARLRGAHQRVDTIARRLRAAGSSRTLTQLRSDIALDLLLYGQIPAATTPQDAAGPETTDTSETTATAGPAKTSDATAQETASQTQAWSTSTAPAAHPPTAAHVTNAPRMADASSTSYRADSADAANTVGACMDHRPEAATAAAPARAANGAQVPERSEAASACDAAGAHSATPRQPAAEVPASTASGSSGPPRRPASPGDGGPKDVPDLSIFDPESTDCSFDPALFKQQLPPAHVAVTVGLSTLLGLDREPGLLGGADGQDYLDAETIRAAAMAAGSTWRRLVTDPLTGHAVELSTTAYRPGDRLTRAVWARDQECRVPGCTTPAHRSDLDHDIDHDRGGPTDLSNLSAKHRRHHNHKTSGRWRSTRDGDLITWTTAAGRTYTSHPADYRPMSREPSVSILEAQLDVMLATDVPRRPELHPEAWGPDHSLDETPPPPPPPPPVDPGEPPF